MKIKNSFRRLKIKQLRRKKWKSKQALFRRWYWVWQSPVRLSRAGRHRTTIKRIRWQRHRRRRWRRKWAARKRNRENTIGRDITNRWNPRKRHLQPRNKRKLETEENQSEQGAETRTLISVLRAGKVVTFGQKLRPFFKKSYALFLGTEMKIAESQTKKINASHFFWRVLLVAGFLSFLIYGLSFFASRPTIETITTRPPQIESSKQPMQNVKFQSKEKKH